MSIAARVEEILRDSLYRPEEVTGNAAPAEAVTAEGVMAKFAFHPGRLESHKAEIAEICNQLPDEFQESKGGGWSFLNLCMTKDGQQWGEHRNCDQLVALAIASKQGSFLLPRDLWTSLPGSMPYVQFSTAS